jgi:hypothetical protein
MDILVLAHDAFFGDLQIYLDAGWDHTLALHREFSACI